MNERIRQFAEQAGFRSDVTVTDGNNKRIDTKTSIALEKFAKLIVEESINVVNRRYMGDNNREDFEVRRCVEDLKKHFGVEE